MNYSANCAFSSWANSATQQPGKLRHTAAGIVLKQRQRPVKLAPRIAAEIPDLQACPVAPGDSGGLAAHPFIVRRQDQDLLIEVFAGGRRGKAAVFPLQQRKAQLLLQRLYLLGDGRLRDEIFLRRRRKAAQADDGLKVFELLQHMFTALLLDLTDLL